MAAPDIASLRALRREITEQKLTIEEAGSHYTFDELVAALRSLREGERAAISEWNEEQLHIRPAGGTGDDEDDHWSATEIITHLLGTQNWYMMNMGRLIGKREHFDVMPRGLGDLAEQNLSRADLLSRLQAETERFFAFLAEIPAGSNMAATRDSTFFGPLSLRGWVFLAIVHDLDHFAQIARIEQTN